MSEYCLVGARFKSGTMHRLHWSKIFVVLLS